MALVPLTIRSRSGSPKSNHLHVIKGFFNDVSMHVWSKYGHWFERQSADKAFSKSI